VRAYARYRDEERQREKRRIYNASPEARRSRARYETSAKCREYRKRWTAQNEKDPRRIEAKKLYRESPKGKRCAFIAARKAELKQLGATEAEYQRMLRKQNGVCWICHEPPNGRSLCVDHCHVTGKRRGLLCHTCNVAVGGFGDDPSLLRRALKYLEVFN
jgi:hypothetical protein